MKLFTIYLGYGVATAVAQDVFGVLLLIVRHSEIRSRFTDLDDKLWDAKEILEHIHEVPGYTVEGKIESIINYHIE